MIEMPDRFCEYECDILDNNFGITDPSILEELDSYISAIRLGELHTKGINGNFGFDHLKKIHEVIFSDLYDFAGKVRNVDIQKQGTYFCRCLYIEQEARKIFRSAHTFSHNYEEVQYTQSEVADKLAYYMSEINMLHPFREGNGRATREYIRQMALTKGYDLDWSTIGKDEFIDAMITSKVDTDDLGKLLELTMVETDFRYDNQKDYSKEEIQEKDYNTDELVIYDI